MKRVPIGSSLLCLGFLSLACGGSSQGSSSIGSGAGTTTTSAASGGSGGAVSTFPEAPHPPLPQVKNFGGPVLATPAFVAVTFPGDSLGTQIDDFVAKIGATPYWVNNAKEYGVGPATALGPVHQAANPFPGTVDDAQIKTWIATEIASAGLPAGGGNTIYALFFGDGQTVTHQGATSCQQFSGYHEEAPIAGGQSVPYVIVPRCPNASNGLTGIAQVTGAASHELFEAATDPYANTKPAYQEVFPTDFGWEIGLGGGEIADLCQTNQDAFFQPPGFAYTVQRTWSNAAAMAGHDPCVPAPAGSYFNSAPVLPDTISLSLVENGMPTQVGVQGVHIPVGSNKTIELDLFSDGATSGPWSVSAKDAGMLLSFSFDKTTGQNGDKLHLTITAMSASFLQIEPFTIESTSGATTNLWVGLVGN